MQSNPNNSNKNTNNSSSSSHEAVNLTSTPVASTKGGDPSSTAGSMISNTSGSIGSGANTGTSNNGTNNIGGPGGGGGDGKNGNANDNNKNTDISAEEVLKFLQEKGMGSAVLELKKKLENDNNTNGSTSDAATTAPPKSLKDQIEEDEAVARNQRKILFKSTGGGYGYDLDSAAPIVQWGIPDVEVVGDATTATTSRTTSKGKKPIHGKAANNKSLADRMGVEEARALLDAFVSFQLWVLSLPDHDRRQATINPISWAEQLLKKNKIPITSLVQQIANHNQNQNHNENDHKDDSQNNNNDNNFQNHDKHVSFYNLPPSCKPELFSVSFALFCHTYCELLEVGMEYTAHVIRDTFKCVYEPLYMKEFHDLQKCQTTEDIMRLNSYNAQHLEALANLKSISVQVAGFLIQRDELESQQQQQQQQQQQINHNKNNDPTQKQIAECNRSIAVAQQKYADLQQRASIAFDKMHDLPFLRRARAVRWQLTMSSQTYQLLTSFLNSHDHNILAMSTLLQTKCELHIEQRDPLPFTPACILLEDDNFKITTGGKSSKSSNKNDSSSALELNKLPVTWAAPSARSAQNPYLDTTSGSQEETSTKLPFPKYHLDEEYEDEATAQRDVQSVKFNRSLLMNGFRRLEALERKREYDVFSYSHTNQIKKKRIPNHYKSNKGATNGGGGTNTAATSTNDAGSVLSMDDPQYYFNRELADPLQPSILLSTLCSNVSGPLLRPPPSHESQMDISSIWEESGIGLCCAKLCPPDGRRIAVGCDDAAIRIWSLLEEEKQGDGEGQRRTNKSNNKIKGSEPVQVLLGHKNGFPVFDIDWNRDGRSLLSAGGDGSIRLWDTLAVGPFGTTKQIQPSSVPKDEKNNNGTNNTAANGGTTTAGSNNKKGTTATTAAGAKNDDNKPGSTSLSSAAATASMDLEDMIGDGSGMYVPGLKPEDTVEYCCGAALAVYRGHAPNTPIWSVKFAPCGYYFASAGSDSTARVWVTDRLSPVRLFAGHTSTSVHCVNWHPNCNYIITGSEDKTARLWDVQTGRAVRIFNGCPAGIHAVSISPCGQYATGADYTGIVHVWDMATAKKITELHSTNTNTTTSSPSSQQQQQHGPVVNGVNGASGNHSSVHGGASNNTKTNPSGRSIIMGGNTNTNNMNTTTSTTFAGTSTTMTKFNNHNKKKRITNCSMIHSLSFSQCGTALATGGDDCSVRIWDVRKENLLRAPPIMDTPVKYFPTRQTVLMDLCYTKRNLLLSVGKYTTPVPLMSSSSSSSLSKSANFIDSN